MLDSTNSYVRSQIIPSLTRRIQECEDIMAVAMVPRQSMYYLHLRFRFVIQKGLAHLGRGKLMLNPRLGV